MSKESRGYSTNSPSAENMSRPAGQDERVDRNRQAAAGYAAQDGFVPDYLQQYLPGGNAYDPSRGRDTAFGQIIGNASDAIGDMLRGGGQQVMGGIAGPMGGGILGALFNANAQQQPGVSRSPRPIMRGTDVQAPNLFGRAGDFLQGRRPLIGMGGVINYEGSTSGANSMVSPAGDRNLMPDQPPAAAPPSAMPSERPSWWPDYLPWPPTPPSAAPMPTYTPPPVAPVMPGQQYSTSYSQLQNAISGAGNPMMMGIGGMLRRP